MERSPVLDPLDVRADGEPVRPRGLRPPRPTGRLRWALGGALLVAGSAFAFAVLVSDAGGRRPVLSVAQDVRAGDTIEDADLAVVDAAIDGTTSPLAASERSAVVGRRAAVDLVPGTLLLDAHLGGRDVEAGRAIVGAALGLGDAPSGLGPGDWVMAVRTSPAAAGDEANPEVLADRALLVSVDAGGEAGGPALVVSLALDESAAPAVAAAASADRLALIAVGGPQ